MPLPHRKAFSRFLSSLLHYRGWKIKELAERAGVSRQWAAKHLHGENPPSRNTRILYAKAFGLDPDQFEVWWRSSPQPEPQDILPMKSSRPYTSPNVDASRHERQEIGLTIPLHTKTSAGRGVDYQLGVLADKFLPSSLLPHPEWGPGAFVVAGDSMAPYFNAGDILIIAERPPGDLRTDDIVIAGMKTGEHTVKKLRIIDEETWQLIPINPAHQVTTIKRDEIEWVVPVMVRIEPIYTRRQVPWEE